MAFGISGTYDDIDGRPTEFGYPYDDRKKAIAAMPDRSIRVIRFYAHGAPGWIGEDNAADLAGMLKDKMKPGGQIHLLGCSTAGVEGHAWNPVGGIGLLSRMIMYHGLMKIMVGPNAGEAWSDNLAGDLSRLVPNVHVMGLSGISFPLSRIHSVFESGYEPSALMADRFVYMNGRLQDQYNNFNLPK